MKKIIYKYLVVMVSFSIVTSCTSELDLNPITEATTGNFYKTASDIEQIVNASYDGLQAKGLYNGGLHFIGEVRSDNTFEESLTNANGRYGDFDIFRLDPSNPVLIQNWKDSYLAIQRANIVLNRINNIDMDAKIKSSRKGEVKFNRALIYFNLVRTYGDVPLVLTETTDPFEAFRQGRTSVTEVYAQIVKDLTEAITELPLSQSEVGRATKGAANALLGKVYLTQKQYGLAVAALKAVAGYSILPNYADVFSIANTGGNNEVIFQVLFRKGINNGDEGAILANQFASTGASETVGGVGETRGSNQASTYLINAFEIGDLRKDASFGEFNGLFYSKKYVNTPANNLDADANVIVLRYADVLLMIAEALNEQGYQASGEAFTNLNLIRTRAGLSALTSATTPDQAAFRLAIEEERRRELCHENHRWFDLVRTGRAITVMNTNNMSGSTSYTVSDYQLLFPVPQNEIDANPKLMKQNPGY